MQRLADSRSIVSTVVASSVAGQVFFCPCKTCITAYLFGSSRDFAKERPSDTSVVHSDSSRGLVSFRASDLLQGSTRLRMTKALWASCRRLNSLARAAARRHNSSYQGIHKVERVEVPTNALEGLNTSVWKPVLFSVLVAGGGCLWMAEKTNYDTSCRKEKLSSSSRGRSMSVAALAWGNTWPSSDDLNRSRQDDVRQRLQGVLNWSKNKYRELTR